MLLAGSVTYENYRHQADVNSAYKLLIDRGMKPENIVNMQFDDIANNPLNPLPGQIIMEPATADNPNPENIYNPKTIDYRGKDVNKKNFFGALLGDKKMANGKVLNSGPDDNIFLFMVDHGIPGVFMMPGQGEDAEASVTGDDVLWADEF